MPKKQEEIKETKDTNQVINLDSIEVNDPQVLRPRELPLVIKPTNGGEWSNKEQAEYAAVLNGYAYRNPEKWETKKDVLIAQLLEIGKNPGKIVLYRGNVGNVTYKNKIIEQ